MRVQRLLGSDIAMAFDECPPAGVDRARVEAAVRRTGIWAAPQPRPAAGRGPARRSGSSRAVPTSSCAERSAEEIVGIGFDGYAVGGLSVGEKREPMLETLAATTELLPADSTPLPDGRGRPAGPDRGRSPGASTCSTACSRPGWAAPARRSSPAGRINLRNAGFATDPRPARRGMRVPRVHRASPAPTSATSSPSRRSRGCACSRSTTCTICSTWPRAPGRRSLPAASPSCAQRWRETPTPGTMSR